MALVHVRIVSPNKAYPKISQAITNFESEAKFNIRKGFLESLSGEMVYYILPAGVMMEASSGGSVFVAKLKDSALVLTCIRQLVALAIFGKDCTYKMAAISIYGGDLWEEGRIFMMGEGK